MFPVQPNNTSVFLKIGALFAGYFGAIYYKRNMRHFDIIRSLPFSFNIVGDKTGMTIRLKVFLFLSLIFFL